MSALPSSASGESSRGASLPEAIVVILMLALAFTLATVGLRPAATAVDRLERELESRLEQRVLMIEERAEPPEPGARAGGHGGVR